MQSSLVATIGFVDEFSLPRIAQLFNKTNQFNLTTKRYSQTELERIASQPENSLWYCDLTDKFGDYGIIGASLLCQNTIDSFLISCRAFGRNVEDAFLWVLLSYCMERGYRHVFGLSVPTPKNAMTSSFYKNAGFKNDGCDGITNKWKLDLTAPLLPPPKWITLKEKNDARQSKQNP